jgi:hypothetical protein
MFGEGARKFMSVLSGTCTFLIIAGILAAPAAAQDSAPDTVMSMPGVTVETSVSQAEMFIGDRITYTVAITYDSTIDLLPPPLGANLGAFEVKDYRPDVETRLKDGRIRSETVFTISTFTTGDYVVPPLPVIFMMPDSSSRLILTEGIPVKVKSLLGEGADTLDIKPLKAQYEFDPEIPTWYYWVGVVLALLLAALVWWLIHRKRVTSAELVDTRTAWEIAFEDLAMLQQKRYLVDGRHKLYYFELADIARAFLGRMYRVDVLEMTTSEFARAFAVIGLPGDWYNRMGEFFTHADLVKFARFTPDFERSEHDLSLVHDLIADVRDERLRQIEAESPAHNGKRRIDQGEKAA